MNKVSLPDGAWAMLRDPETITERQRRPLKRLQQRVAVTMAAKMGGMDELADVTPAEFLKRMTPHLDAADLEAMGDIDDLIIVAFVDSWSYDLPLSVEGALDLPGNVRKALLKECAPLVATLAGETTDGDVLDPESPTVPANGSDRP